MIIKQTYYIFSELETQEPVQVFEKCRFENIEKICKFGNFSDSPSLGKYK